jgi:hypothetical protein
MVNAPCPFNDPASISSPTALSLGRLSPVSAADVNSGCPGDNHTVRGHFRTGLDDNHIVNGQVCDEHSLLDAIAQSPATHRRQFRQLANSGFGTAKGVIFSTLTQEADKDNLSRDEWFTQEDSGDDGDSQRDIGPKFSLAASHRVPRTRRERRRSEQQ